MNKFFILAPVAFLLASCGGRAVLPTPQPIVVPVDVPIAAPPVGCVPDTLGAKPNYVDTDEALKKAGPAGDDDAIAKRMQLLYAGRSQRTSRLNEIEPIIAKCPHGNSKK